MDLNELEYARARTDQKLAYSDLYLKLLQNRVHGNNSDLVECAHNESFLIHLFGAKDVFLQELNMYYGFGLPKNGVTANNLKQKADDGDIQCAELLQLNELEADSNSWLSHAKNMRHYLMHQGGIPRVLLCGGPKDGQVWLRNPKSDFVIEQNTRELLETWLGKMSTLLNQLRTTALVTNQL